MAVLSEASAASRPWCCHVQTYVGPGLPLHLRDFVLSSLCAVVVSPAVALGVHIALAVVGTGRPH